MALEEHDREDLVRDGRAFAWRGETQIGTEPVFVGLREDGRWSIYWGNRCVWQFDQAMQIRRAHWRNCRISVEQGQLTWLIPRERGTRLQFERVALDKDELRQFGEELSRSLAQLKQHLQKGDMVWHSAYPDVASVHQKIALIIHDFGT